MPTLPLPAPIQTFPNFMNASVADYRKLAADYLTITDESVRASYKVVLDKKIADLHVMLQTFTSVASSAIDAMKVA